MARPVHFEIHAADLQRAVTFYTEVFGWAVRGLEQLCGVALLRPRDGPRR